MGPPPCPCRAQGLCRCDPERFYRAPTATWGYDADRAPYFFGHRYFQPCVVTAEQPLPLQGRLAPAHAPDCTMGPTSLARWRKTWTAPHLPVTVRAAVYDRGPAALGGSHGGQAKHSAPVSALHPRRGAPPAPTGPAPQGTDQGSPLSPAGLPMRRPSHDLQRSRLDYTGPAKRPTRRHGRVPGIPPQAECPRHVLGQPDPQRGPVVEVRTAHAPRLSPPIPRDSPQCKALMDRRSGCERSKALTKVPYRWGERPGRSATPFFGRLYRVSLRAHARVWLAEDRKPRGDAPRRLVCGLPAAA